MAKLFRVKRKPLPALVLIHDDPITINNTAGHPIQGVVQVIDDRPGEGDDTWLLRDEKELWAYYELVEDEKE